MGAEEVMGALDKGANLELGGLSSFAGGAMDWVTLILWAVIIVGGAFFIAFVLMKYKHKVILFKRDKQGNLLPKTVRVMRVKEKKGNTFRYKELFKKRTFPIGESLSEVYFEDLKGNYIPSELILDKRIVKLNSKPANLDFWLSNQIQESDSIYSNESWWQQNKVMVMNLVMYGVFLVALILILEYMGTLADKLGGIASAFQDGKIILSVPPGS